MYTYEYIHIYICTLKSVIKREKNKCFPYHHPQIYPIFCPTHLKDKYIHLGVQLET